MAEQKFMMDLKLEPSKQRIHYTDKIMLVGSCFTEHMGNHLKDLKFKVKQNPNGILFDPLSVSKSLVSYTRKDSYKDLELFYINDVWQSWQHHSRFSGPDKETVLSSIRTSQEEAHHFLQDAKWLMITLGTSFFYRLKEDGSGVANCHKAPASLFNRHMLTIEEINTAMDNCLHQLFHFNPELQVIFTVSPVRHARDGLVDNNRSKSRLIEVVHHLVNKFDRLHYFPAYELVIDVLRDYRFYDVDLVHPNFQATQFVTEKFASSYFDPVSLDVSRQVQEIINSVRHRSFHPEIATHQRFLRNLLEKIEMLKSQHPFLDFEMEEKQIMQQLITR